MPWLPVVTVTFDTPVSPCFPEDEAMMPDTERWVPAEPVSEPVTDAAELGMPRAEAME